MPTGRVIWVPRLVSQLSLIIIMMGRLQDSASVSNSSGRLRSTREREALQLRSKRFNGWVGYSAKNSTFWGVVTRTIPHFCRRFLFVAERFFYRLAIEFYSENECAGTESCGSGYRI